MTVFAATLLVILLAIGGLCIGLAFGRAPIRGSCGGIACAGIEPCADCPNRSGEAKP